MTTEAIVTLDVINEICHPEGKRARYAGRIAESQMIEKINRLTDWGRQRGSLIIHVRVGFRSHYKEAAAWSPVFAPAAKDGALALDGWGGQFCDELNVDSADVQVVKHRISAFYGTDLDLILRANRIETVLLGGVATNMAVELTAREAHDRDYMVKIVEDATQCAGDAEQEASKRVLSRLATWVTLDDLLQ